MHPKAVLVTFNHPVNHNPISGTGVIFGDGLVLTHATILSPLLHIATQHRWLKSFISSLSNNVEKSQILSNNVKFRVYEDSSNNGAKMIPGEMAVKGAWRCPLVTKSVKSLLNDWTLGDIKRSKDITVDAEAAKDLMSIFLLLSPPEASSTLGSLLCTVVEPLRGQEVLVESTPFGSDLFMNSLSRGIISNVLGCEKSLLLTDARTVTGCEGGPIFGLSNLRLSNNEKGKLVGLVSCSLTWWRGEWVGLTIGVSLAPILRRLESTSNPVAFAPFLHIENALSNDIGQAVIDQTVVLVRTGCSWGSGVIIDSVKGIILTCSHVVKNTMFDEIKVFHRGSTYLASLVLRTRDNLAYDVAVLKIEDTSQFTEQMEMSDCAPEMGDSVVAAGFPLVSERDDKSLLPTMVHGCVARVGPSMLQTTCCIQSGASGGAVLRHGKLIGLVVCNAQDSNSGALFPHVNFAIPITCIRDALTKYIETDDESYLTCMESSELAVQRVWRLQSSKL